MCVCVTLIFSQGQKEMSTPLRPRSQYITYVPGRKKEQNKKLIEISLELTRPDQKDQTICVYV